MFQPLILIIAQVIIFLIGGINFEKEVEKRRFSAKSIAAKLQLVDSLLHLNKFTELIVCAFGEFEKGAREKGNFFRHA